MHSNLIFDSFDVGFTSLSGKRERERERELGGRDVGWKVIMVLIEGKYGDNCDGGLWISGLNREAFDPSGRPSGF